MQKMIDFLKPFARKVAKDELEETTENKEQQKSEKDDSGNDSKSSFKEVSEKTFATEVLKSDQAQLVYFTTLAQDQDIKNEMKYFNKMIRTFKGVLGISVFRMDAGSPDFSKTAKKYKVGTLNVNKPKLRFYPNRATGDIKDSRSYEIFFNKDAKTFENIETEIVESYEHDVTDIIASSFNQFIVRYAKDE